MSLHKLSFSTRSVSNSESFRPCPEGHGGIVPGCWTRLGACTGLWMDAVPRSTGPGPKLLQSPSGSSKSPRQSPLSPQHLDRGCCVCTSELQEQEQAGTALACCRGSAEARGGDAAFTSPLRANSAPSVHQAAHPDAAFWNLKTVFCQCVKQPGGHTSRGPWLFASLLLLQLEL